MAECFRIVYKDGCIQTRKVFRKMTKREREQLDAFLKEETEKAFTVQLTGDLSSEGGGVDTYDEYDDEPVDYL